MKVRTVLYAAVLIGLVASFGLVRGRFIGRNTLRALFMTPMILPVVVLAVALYAFFLKLGLAGTTAGFVIAHLVVALPFSILALTGALEGFDKSIEDAAVLCGASPLQAKIRITLPAMLPHAIPGLSNLWLIATKDTALLAVVGFSELTLVTRQAAGSTKAYLLFFCAAGALYLALTLVSNIIIRIIETRARRGMAAPA